LGALFYCRERIDRALGYDPMRKKQRNGFSLIELLVVVAIILIVAAIGIPNLLRARISANEASAVSSIHAVNTAEITYTTIFPTVGYSATLLSLGPGGGCNSPANACIIDALLANGTKSGYIFTYVQDTSSTPSPGYTLNADPITRSITGQRSYYSDQTNATHYNQSAVAGLTDPPLQ
jgi:type IV pilus assembly protein PilA